MVLQLQMQSAWESARKTIRASRLLDIQILQQPLCVEDEYIGVKWKEESMNVLLTTIMTTFVTVAKLHGVGNFIFQSFSHVTGIMKITKLHTRSF